MSNKLKSIPSVVQLPGGVKLQGVQFRIMDYDADGRPTTFEILPVGEGLKGADRGCVLFADEEWIRSPMPGKGRS